MRAEPSRGASVDTAAESKLVISAPAVDVWSSLLAFNRTRQVSMISDGAMNPTEGGRRRTVRANRVVVSLFERMKQSYI